MTTRKHLRTAQRGIICALAVAGIAGCSSLNEMLEPNRVEYKSAGKAPSLEIPPDLTKLQRENRYAIPEANRGQATASGFMLQQGARPEQSTVVAPVASSEMRIERAGAQRWLVVKQSPEALWPVLRDFWQDNGFLITQESAQAGVMETDWAENRAKIPEDFLRNALGKALDSLYSTGERDKFRTRLERGPDGTTEIYISHRGMQEVLVGQQKDSTMWTPRDSDPELEAEFLSRLMTRLGADTTRAKAIVANAGLQPIRAKLIKSGASGYVEVDEGFERAWRRVGLALDRVGFTVEDRDRSQGLYFVRYVDPEQDKNKADQGFLSKLFSFGSSNDKAKTAARYQVAVKGAGSTSQVAVLNKDGAPDSSAAASRILTLLNEQLK